MENQKLVVVIKKSKNWDAWSNRFVGQYIEVETGHFGYDDGYKVIFRNNPHLNLDDNLLAGIIYECDCHIVAKETITN